MPSLARRPLRAIALACLAALTVAILPAPPALANGCVGANFPGGSGSAEDPFQVADAGDLAYLASDSRCFGYTFRQTADIALTGTWTPIGNTTFAFTGTYDGDGHSITGVVLPIASYSGLFGVTDGATISDLSVSGGSTADAPALSYAGLLIGEGTDTTVADVTVAGDVAAITLAGGAIGELDGGTVTGLHATGAVTGLAYDFPWGSSMGGLIGSVGPSATTISSSSADSGVISGQMEVGGLIGTMTGTGRITVSDSSSSNTVTAATGYMAGGLVGRAIGVFTIDGSTASGDVTTTASGGGLLGNASGIYSSSVIRNSSASGDVTVSSAGAGGLLGEEAGSEGELISIVDSSATGNVDAAAASSVGGFAGKLLRADVRGSHATGTVTGRYYTGGFVGVTTNTTAISTSYATGAVDGDTATGGFVGTHESSGALTDVYATGAVRGAVTGTMAGWSTGGLAGNLLNAGSIVRGFATGDVSGTVRVGGLVGELDGPSSGTPVSVTDSYATGDVFASGTTEAVVGGIVGLNRDLVTLTNVYATGSVTATSGAREIGGVTGLDLSPLTASGVHWDSETTGLSRAAGTYDNTGADITGASSLTTAQMRSSSSFPGWDFSSVWGYQCGVSTTPQLRWANLFATGSQAEACPAPAPTPSPSQPPTTPSSVPSSTEATEAIPEPTSPTIPPELQPGSAMATIGGVATQPQQMRRPRGRGLTLSAPPVGVTLRSQTRQRQRVPLSPAGVLVVARSGTLPAIGTGLVPGSDVTLMLNSKPIALGGGQADASGAFRIDGRIPAWVPRGEHTLTLAGTTRDGLTFTVALGVEVTSPAAALGASPVLTVAPSRPATGGTVTVRAGGVQAGCRVRFRWAKSGQWVTANSHGVATGNLRVPRRTSAALVASVSGRGCERVTVRHTYPSLTSE